jgi:hypothetical protein
MAGSIGKSEVSDEGDYISEPGVLTFAFALAASRVG